MTFIWIYKISQTFVTSRIESKCQEAKKKCVPLDRRSRRSSKLIIEFSSESKSWRLNKKRNRENVYISHYIHSCDKYVVSKCLDNHFHSHIIIDPILITVLINGKFPCSETHKLTLIWIFYRCSDQITMWWTLDHWRESLDKFKYHSKDIKKCII